VDGENIVIGLVIYDCDGTLIDSERVVAAVCIDAIHALGMRDWTMDRYIATFVGMPGAVGWAAVQKAYGREFPAGFNATIDAEIDRRLASEPLILPGVRDAIVTIGGESCVASSSGLPYLNENIGRAGLLDIFAGKVFSAQQVKRAKPAPDVFLFAASQMGHDPDTCVVIEDSVPGVTAARRAGMHVIGYTGAAHDPVIMGERLRAAGAASIAAHMAGLPGMVEQLRRSA
jgi:HAD superfamily hydrolase (TIGR01509 family)